MKQTKQLFYIGAAFLLFLMVAMPVKADSPPVPPSKESLIAAWEEKISEHPDTVRFEKTKQEGVYAFETTLFPYQGRLKVLNTLIQDRDVSEYEYMYYDYDMEDDSGYIGAVETELLDVQDQKSFFKKYPYSSQAWANFSILFFPNTEQVWMTRSDWNAYVKRENDVSSSDEMGSCVPQKKDYSKLIATWLPIVFLLVFLGFLFLFSRKQREKYDLSFERQKQSVDKQQEGLDMAKEGLSIQKEQLQLLKDILEHVKK